MNYSNDVSRVATAENCIIFQASTLQNLLEQTITVFLSSCLQNLAARLPFMTTIEKSIAFQ
jgi:hypothetical protein